MTRAERIRYQDPEIHDSGAVRLPVVTSEAAIPGVTGRRNL